MAPPARQSLRKRLSVRRLRVLAVDNDEKYLDALRRALPEGWDIRTTKDAQLALHWFETGPFDLVMADLSIKPSGALQFLEEVRRIDPAIRVIVTSIYPASVECFDELRRRGCRYFVKPPDPQLLRETVEDTLLS